MRTVRDDIAPLTEEMAAPTRYHLQNLRRICVCVRSRTRAWAFVRAGACIHLFLFEAMHDGGIAQNRQAGTRPVARAGLSGSRGRMA